MKIVRWKIVLMLLLLSQVTLGSDLFFDDYNWEINPEFEQLPFEYERQNAVILKDFKAIEFYFDETFDDLLQLYTVHSKIQVNTHEAVEIYNKHYMPMNRVLEIIDLRVRVITKDQVLEIYELDLKDHEGEDDYSSYKYFAIDGVEVGSQIEYIYTFKMMPKLEGGREYFQSDELKLNTEFHLYCDDKMFFNTKSYNGFETLKLDTTEEGKNHYFASMEIIEPLKPELYAPYNNSLMRIEYKLDHIDPAEEVKLYTYDQISNQLNNYLRSGINKKDIKALKKLSKKLNLDLVDEMEKVRIIEDYIKRNITISQSDNLDQEEIAMILENLVTNQKGLMKLYVSIFDINAIPYKFGLTSDRTRVMMDPDFESYSFLENYFFYFQEYDKFMAPTEMFYRVGYIPFNWSNNHGLFINNVSEGESNVSVGEVDFIEPLAYDQNEDLLDIKIEFEGEFEVLNIDIKRTLSGYNATYIQPIFELVPESDVKLVVSDLLNLAGKDFELKEYQLRNSSIDSIYMKPFIIEGKASTTSSFY